MKFGVHYIVHCGGYFWFETTVSVPPFTAKVQCVLVFFGFLLTHYSLYYIVLSVLTKSREPKKKKSIRKQGLSQEYTTRL